MAEVVPGVAAFAIVLTHSAPLAIAEVRPPLLPGHCLVPSLVQANVFSRHRCLLWLSPRSWKGRSRSGRALIQCNSPDPFGSSDFSDSLTFQRLAPGESRIPVISFNIACPECSRLLVTRRTRQDDASAQSIFTDEYGSLPASLPAIAGRLAPGSGCRRLASPMLAGLLLRDTVARTRTRRRLESFLEAARTVGKHGGKGPPR